MSAKHFRPAAQNERLSGTDRSMPGKPKLKNLSAAGLYKAKVIRSFPKAYCLKLDNGTGYVVWATKNRPRGIISPAIGFGTTARAAWRSVKFTHK